MMVMVTDVPEDKITVVTDSVVVTGKVLMPWPPGPPPNPEVLLVPKVEEPEIPLYIDVSHQDSET